MSRPDKENKRDSKAQAGDLMDDGGILGNSLMIYTVSILI